MPLGMTPEQCTNDGDCGFHKAKYKYIALILFLGYFPITGSLFLKEGTLLRPSGFSSNNNCVKENRDVHFPQTIEDKGVEVLKATIQEGPQAITKIALLGERHSGTNWITNHLEECYSEVFEVSLINVHGIFSIFICLHTFFLLHLM
mmetsp:Transcript_28034/g.58189  ORF Transcript_28034/g.58189 Transcript_28034/m.58189 type:complete len:147 (-) Transcript_28034:40-480(-)